MLAEVAEQGQEFHRHGYQLVAIGEHDWLAGALAAVDVPFPTR
jgi:hypothetical protein